MANDYDLESVTAQLKAMEARRREWQRRKSVDAKQQQLPDREPTCGFELGPADLSSGGSDADSDDGYQTNSTNSLPSDDDNGMDSRHQLQTSKRQTGRGKARTLRVTDSLDLSMSVAMSNASSFQVETLRNSHTDQRTTKSKVPREERKQRDLEQNINNQAASCKQPECNVCRPSRIPKLVQQRRQLQAGMQRNVHTRGSLKTPSSVVSCNVPASEKQNNASPPTGDILGGNRELSKLETLPHSTGSPIRRLPKSDDSTSAIKGKASNLDGLLEEMDSTSSEERLLLQSLEKLDRRLTNVSTSSVGRGGRVLSKDTRRVRRNSESNSSVCTTNSEIDEETLRTAAYGGGTHVKQRQPASVSVRSSSAKRAELSSGVHKARVRVGGALLNDAGRKNCTDGSGKHKIVVKKELAHLLF